MAKFITAFLLLTALARADVQVAAETVAQYLLPGGLDAEVCFGADRCSAGGAWARVWITADYGYLNVHAVASASSMRELATAWGTAAFSDRLLFSGSFAPAFAEFEWIFHHGWSKFDHCHGKQPCN